AGRRPAGVGPLGPRAGGRGPRAAGWGGTAPMRRARRRVRPSWRDWLLARAARAWWLLRTNEAGWTSDGSGRVRLLAHGPTAVRTEHLPGDELRLVAGQIHRCPRDVVRIAEPPHPRLRPDEPARL